jgi:hypothetical protein
MNQPQVSTFPGDVSNPETARRLGRPINEFDRGAAKILVNSIEGVPSAWTPHSRRSPRARPRRSVATVSREIFSSRRCRPGSVDPGAGRRTPYKCPFVETVRSPDGTTSRLITTRHPKRFA